MKEKFREENEKWNKPAGMQECKRMKEKSWEENERIGTSKPIEENEK